jgi:Subtilase family/Fibronectin type-III domain/PA domain
MRPQRKLGALVGALLALGLVAGSTASAIEPGDLTAKPLTPVERISGTKSVSGKLAQTDPNLLTRNDGALVDVVIKLDYDATASYAGGIEGLAATSPRATGKPLNRRAANVQRYEAYIAGQEKSVLSALRKQVPSAKVGLKLHTVYGGFAARIPANSVERVLAIPGVAAVQADTMNKILTDSSPAFINATDVYPDLGGTPNAGAGVIFGDLDTGVWPEHPSLADQGNLGAPPPRADSTPRTCNFGDNPLTPANDPFVCQNKLIGGEPFLATYLSNPARAAAEPYHTARDSNGHGTHTTTTSAGNVVEQANPLGVDRGTIHGIAPGAWVIEYKVCGIQGCVSSDSAAAVAEAILDGVDVINFSISGGTNPFADPVELAFLDAYAAGVFVSASAGNEGPGAGTANHLSPWVTSVAASTQKRAFESTLTLNASGGASATFTGASLTAGVSSAAPVVLSSAAPYSNDFCGAPAAPATFTGKIVACKRGGDIARVDKGYNVFQGGAVGMILYNPSLADVETDNHWLPTVHLADGTAFLAFLAGHTGVTATFTDGQKVNGQGDVMAAFSSRGPAGLFVKPDVTAPGVQILAGNTPTPESPTEGPPGEYFQAIAGTSMSSPHVAGAALLLADSHPGWTPGQIKSALMTSAITGVVKEDLSTPADPFDFGAGRINVGQADDVRLTFDETAARYFAMGGDPILAAQLNLPSINAPVLPGRLTVARTARNVSSSNQKFDVVTHAPAGSSITVSPSSFQLDAGQSRTLSITIETEAPIGAQQFASIEIRPNSGARQHLPVAFIHTQGDVNLSQDCAPATINKNQTATCDVTATNNSFGDTVVDLDTYTTSGLPIVGSSGATVIDDKHVQLHGVTLAGAQPGIPSLAPGTIAGYIPLTSLGVTPDPVGDEDILNFNVPAFEYAGETWSSIGVDSNGYAIIGGGSSEDNNCCNIPSGPYPSRPNNVLAPFWTDLDGTGAPGVYAALLTDGVDTWLVIEWQVNVFGTTSNRHFQTWIGVNGTEDIVFAYDPAALPADPAGQPFAVRVENKIGQGDDLGALPTEDLRVASTSPVAGESAGYSITLKGAKPGDGTVRTEMVAEGVPGVTVEKDTITVVK